MRRRKGDERLEHMQGVGWPMARGVDRGEVDIGVGEARLEFDRPQRRSLRAIIFALVEQQVREVAVHLGVVRRERKRLRPALFGVGRAPEALQRIAEVVQRLRVVRFEFERPLEAEPALVELQRLLQNDAEIVPCRREARRSRDRPPPGVFGFGEQALLAAHLGQVAEVDRRGARRLAGAPHLHDGEIEVAIRVGHEAQ